MQHFPFHTQDSAPDEAKPLLQAAEQKMGFVPNVFAYMAEAPASLEAYLSLSQIFAKSSLSAQEQQIVLLAASVENGCEFCVAAHSMGAKQMAGVKAGVVNAIRDRRLGPDPRLQALADFTQAVVEQRGRLEQAQLNAFLGAGFTRKEALEVILGVSLKTLSNYTNHLTHPETNPELQEEAWQA